MNQEFENGREAARKDTAKRETFAPYRTDDFVRGYNHELTLKSGGSSVVVNWRDWAATCERNG